MSVKAFFTSFHDSLSDLKTYHDFKKELGMRLVEDEFFNSLEGKKVFNAFVLQVNQANPTQTSDKTSGGGYTILKVRPIDLHDSFIPEPCDFRTARFRQELIDMHPTAYSEGIGLTNSFAVGDVVECYFDVQGPDFEGIMRGLRFRDNAQQRLPGHHKYSCLENYEAKRGGDAFAQGNARTSTLANNTILTNRNNIIKSPGNKSNRNINRTVIFENIKFSSSETTCRPANPNSETFLGYLGRDQFDLYLKILSGKESGGKYDIINPQGYSGKYQYSFYNMYKYHKVIKKTVWENFSRGQTSAYKNQKTKASQKEVNRLLNLDSSWSGEGGVISKETFGDPAIGGPVQEKGHIRFTSRYFKGLKDRGLIEDLNNIAHVVGLMTAAHLKGLSDAEKLVTATTLNDDPDGNGIYPSYYYVSNGQKFMDKCAE